MDNTKAQRFYLPELDGLRFFAFLLVFIHNSPYLKSSIIWTAFYEYGWVGVDLFFCLSAFLITKLLVLEHQQMGKINTRNFYLRRILRIWPLYFVYIAIALIFSCQKLGWDHLLQHLAGLFTFTFNFAYIFLAPKVIVLFIHLWTISYEEQFYALIPWLLQKLLKASTKSNASFLTFLLIAGLLMRSLFIYFDIKHPAIYMLPFTHFESMLGGVAIGLGFLDPMLIKIRGWILPLGVLSVFVIFFLPNTYEIGWGLLPTYLLSGLGMTLIVFSTVNNEQAFIGKLLTNKAIAYLGKISYGLYIFHLLANSLASNLFKTYVTGGISQNAETYSLFVFFTGLTFTIFLASISYYIWEKPFLALKNRYGVIASRPL